MVRGGASTTLCASYSLSVLREIEFPFDFLHFGLISNDYVISILFFILIHLFFIFGFDIANVSHVSRYFVIYIICVIIISFELLLVIPHFLSTPSFLSFLLALLCFHTCITHIS